MLGHRSQVKAGTIIGDLPPYEAFCMGGSNSIRGWYDCDLAVARTFGEVTLEYRFPIISVFSGELFVDAGTDFDTQKNVPGKPGLLLNKDGSGVSVGTGVIVGTPVVPFDLRSRPRTSLTTGAQPRSGLEVLVTLGRDYSAAWTSQRGRASWDRLAQRCCPTVPLPLRSARFSSPIEGMLRQSVQP